MKPDNKKGRSKKRGPAGYYGGWARNRIVKAKEIMRNVRNAGKLVGKHEKARPKHEHLETAIMLGIMMKRYGFSLRGNDVRTVLQARLAQGGRLQGRPVKVVAAQVAEEGAHEPARRADPVHRWQGVLRILLGGLNVPPVQPVRLG